MILINFDWWQDTELIGEDLLPPWQALDMPGMRKKLWAEKQLGKGPTTVAALIKSLEPCKGTSSHEEDWDVEYVAPEDVNKMEKDGGEQEMGSGASLSGAKRMRTKTKVSNSQISQFSQHAQGVSSASSSNSNQQTPPFHDVSKTSTDNGMDKQHDRCKAQLLLTQTRDPMLKKALQQYMSVSASCETNQQKRLKNQKGKWQIIGT